MIFDGKAFAREIELELKNKVPNLVFRPKIVSILVGNHPASVLYTKLKKEAAERVGIEFEVVKLDTLKNEMEEIGEKSDVTGVMVQLPLPELLRGRTPKYLGQIPLDKDVDGLRWEDSGIMPATVRAIMKILERIAEKQSSEPCLWDRKFVVLGARGAVGRPLTHFLRARGVGVSEVEWDTPSPGEIVRWGEVIISCVGKAGIVTGEMVSEGVIVIDVGSPKGDMTQEVYQKASVSVEVPGGVGPVTIACLMDNAIDLM